MISMPNNMKIENEGEKIFFEFLNDNLNDEFILYHNYEIKGKEFDFFLINKELGLFIFEVKSWSGYEIIDVHDSSKITYRNNLDIEEYDGNPLKQARLYKFNILNKLKEKFDIDVRIVHVAVYPKMSENYFNNKNMNLYTERERCILKNDLLSKDIFVNKLKKIKEIDDINNKKISEEEFLKIRSLFENINVTNKINLENKKIVNEFLSDRYNDLYSIFIYLRKVDYQQEILNTLINSWKKGAKVHLLSDDNDLLDVVKNKLLTSLGFLSKYKSFNIIDKNNSFKDSIYNFNFYHYKEKNIKSSFYLINGIINNYDEALKEIDKYTNFNYNQFILEHYEVNKDIIVEAGAGTGKTYSMISRITYLIYKHNYSSEEILKKIAMITFTNEAANNMKKRLKEYYENYYLLTKNIKALELIEGIDNMKISTIHSLSKNIIDKFSHLIGLGTNSSIYSGKYELDKIINQHLNNYNLENYKDENMVEDIEYRLFKFSEIIRIILEKLEQKNIYLSNGYILDEGQDKKCEIINEILPKIQIQSIEESIKNNKVKLSQVMIIILDVLNNKKEYIKDIFEIDYLFIDEFQDTDDVQIDIIKKFKEIIGFNLLVVGDIKQCIYRFRGADESAFKRLREGNENTFKNFELTKNYRSDKILLENLNNIFETWTFGNYLDYKTKLIGIKELYISEKRLEEVKYNQYNFEEYFVQQLKNEINLMKECNTKGEIAILVRTNNEIEEIIKIAARNGINIKADVGNNLFETIAVKDLYRLVIAIKFNLDPKCLFGLFNTNYVVSSYSKSELIKFRGERSKQIEYFNKVNSIVKWNYYLESTRNEPIMKVIREIIIDLKPWNVYASKFEDENEQKKQAIIYIRDLEQLIEWIIRSSNNDYLTINKLANKLEIAIFTNVSKESRFLEDSNKSDIEIICATVHKTKGLEYETVIIPYCNKNKNIKQDIGKVEILIDEVTKKVGYSFRDDQKMGKSYKRINNNIYNMVRYDELKLKLNEEVRILYVALTRAISRIVYFSEEKDRKKDEIRWQDFINKNI
ncbi:UvrD-helicase domain-containing protein [Clostridium sp. HCS.1]|uniref:UvrD-helicase domain-containing protein n=1 Tax=Clostridium sp. HCS.1 TaxID=3238594 RepID=UPI003A101A79